MSTTLNAEADIAAEVLFAPPLQTSEHPVSSQFHTAGADRRSDGVMQEVAPHPTSSMSRTLWAMGMVYRTFGYFPVAA